MAQHKRHTTIIMEHTRYELLLNLLFKFVIY